MFHAPMVDMARKAEEIDTAINKPTSSAYPYGLCLSLDDETLKKLGMGSDLPNVGDEAHICCEVKVTAVSQNENEGPDGTKSAFRRVELQITEMGIAGDNEISRSEQASAMRKKRWYGSADEPDADDMGE